jgi:hypothetical protein
MGKMQSFLNVKADDTYSYHMWSMLYHFECMFYNEWHLEPFCVSAFLVFMSVGLHTQDTSTEYEHTHETQRNMPQLLGNRRVENKTCIQAHTQYSKKHFHGLWCMR